MESGQKSEDPQFWFGLVGCIFTVFSTLFSVFVYLYPRPKKQTQPSRYQHTLDRGHPRPGACSDIEMQFHEYKMSSHARRNQLSQALLDNIQATVLVLQGMGDQVRVQDPALNEVEPSDPDSNSINPENVSEA